MDIKIHFTKKSCSLVVGLLLCGTIILGGWYVSPLKARYDIKATCQNNCGCFDNVVDYRLTNDQARLFSKFIKEIGKRQDASALEFMDAAEAIRIQQAFDVCKPQVKNSVEQQTIPNQVSEEQQTVTDKKMKNKK